VAWHQSSRGISPGTRRPFRSTEGSIFLASGAPCAAAPESEASRRRRDPNAWRRFPPRADSGGLLDDNGVFRTESTAAACHYRGGALSVLKKLKILAAFQATKATTAAWITASLRSSSSASPPPFVFTFHRELVRLLVVQAYCCCIREQSRLLQFYYTCVLLRTACCSSSSLVGLLWDSSTPSPPTLWYVGTYPVASTCRAR
jgi:hypothetical protein